MCNMSNTPVDLSWLTVRTDHMVRYNHGRRKMCFVKCGENNDIYCCSFRPWLPVNWCCIMQLPVLMICLYLGLFRLTAFWIGSVWTESKPLKVPGRLSHSSSLEGLIYRSALDQVQNVGLHYSLCSHFRLGNICQNYLYKSTLENGVWGCAGIFSVLSESHVGQELH